MGWTLELYDQDKNVTYDLTGQCLGFQTTKALDQGVNSFNVQLINIYDVHKKNLITIKKNGVTWLKGIVINQRDSQQQGLKYTIFECADNAFFLGRRLVAEVYRATEATGGLPSKIIKDLIDNYLYESGFTHNNVRASTTPIITQPDVLEFPYVYAQDAIDRIMEHITDWHYYIDNNRDFHFFYRYESVGSQQIFENKYYPERSIAVKDSLTMEYIGEDEFNRVWIIGAKNPAETAINQYFTTDGSQKYFNLSYESYDLRAYLDGVEKKVLQESNDDGDADFLLDDSNRVLYIPPYRTLSGAIRVNYKPARQIIDKFENQGSIAKFGLYEKIVKDSDITTRSSARKIGLAEINKKSNVKRIVSFSTRTELSLGKMYNIDILADTKNPDGTVNVNVWDYRGNFLLKEISTDITPEDTLYHVYFEEVVS